MYSIIFVAINIMKSGYIHSEFGLNGVNDLGFGDYIILYYFRKIFKNFDMYRSKKEFWNDKTVAQLNP